MPLPTTGQISLAAIGSEAKQDVMTAVSLDSSEIRKLPNKKTARSTISVSDFYGRAFGVGAGYADANFVSKLNQPAGVVVESNTIASPHAATLGLTCTTDAQYRVNNGAWIDKSVVGSVSAGDLIQLRVTTSSLYSTNSNATLNLSGTQKVFQVATGASESIYIYVTLLVGLKWTETYVSAGNYSYRVTEVKNRVKAGDSDNGWHRSRTHPEGLDAGNDFNTSPGVVSSSSGVFSRTDTLRGRILITRLAGEGGITPVDFTTTSTAISGGAAEARATRVLGPGNGGQLFILITAQAGGFSNNMQSLSYRASADLYFE